MKTFNAILFTMTLTSALYAQPAPIAPRAAPFPIPIRTNRVAGLTNLTVAQAAAAAPVVVAPAVVVPPGPGLPAAPNPVVPAAPNPLVPAIVNPAAAVPPVAPAPAAVAPAAAPPPGDVGDGGDVPGNLPPGLIKFSGTDLDQVLDFYQELTGRTILRPTALPQTK